jgi:hypothetical protein
VTEDFIDVGKASDRLKEEMFSNKKLQKLVLSLKALAA